MKRQSSHARLMVCPALADDQLRADALRDRLIDTLGNLTIVTSCLNISLGHENFDAKRAKLAENTLLAINKPICDRESWDEAAIAERAHQLGALAESIWDRPSLQCLDAQAAQSYGQP